MFNNKFLKKDPLLEAVKAAQADGETRRAAVAMVNEEFGVYSRNAVIRENLAAYDARIEETYKALKEGKWEGSKEDKAEDKKLAKKHGMSMKQWEKSAADKKHDAKEKMDEAKLAKKDYDKDGKIESPKDEVWGSRFRAAKAAGKMEEGTATSDLGSETKMSDAGHPGEYHTNNTPAERNTKATFDRMRQMKEEQIDELSKGTLQSYVDKSYDRYNGYAEPKERKSKRMAGRTLAVTKMGHGLKGIHKDPKVMAKEETQIDELSRTTLKSYVKKADRQANRIEDKVRAYKDKPGEEEKMYKRIDGANLARDKMKVRVAAREETDYSAQDRAPVTKSAPKEDPSTPKTPYTGYKGGNRAGDVIDSAKGALKEAVSRKHFQQVADLIKGHESQEKRNELASHHAGIFAKQNPRFNAAKFHAASGSTAHEEPKKVQEAAYSAKAARAGKDIGKPGKNFEKIAKKAGAKYGSEEKGKKVAGAILAKIRAKHMKEDSSFNAAQVTGKSVDEAVDAGPTPSWVNQPAPGVHRASAKAGVQRLQGSTFFRGTRASTAGQGSAKLVPQTTARASAPPPAGSRALVPSGNRAPATTGGASRGLTTTGSKTVTATPSSSSGGSGFSYSRGPDTPGVNPPRPEERIRGGDAFKAAASGGGRAGVRAGLGAMARTLGGPEGAVAAALAPVLGDKMRQSHQQGHSATPGVSAHQSTPGVKASDSFARMKQMKAPEPAPVAKAEAPKAAEPTVKQSFSQAYKAARTAAGSKAQFSWGGKDYQAAAKKSEYVAPSKQVKVDVGSSASSAAAKPAPTVPTPPSRPADLNVTSAPKPDAATPAPSTDTSTSMSVSGKRTEFGNSAKYSMPNDMKGSYDGPSPANTLRMPKALKGVSEEEKKELPDFKADIKAGGPMASPLTSKDFAKRPPSVMKEEVQVGDNKYRIV